MRIIVSADSKFKAKEYPYMTELVKMLNDSGHEVIYAKSITGFYTLDELNELILSCDTYIAVDSFFQHYAWYLGKKGIVLFGKSDPRIFGHSENINLYKKDRLRKFQFLYWKNEIQELDDWVSPHIVLTQILNISNVYK